jgi:hypothetical protein
MTTDPTPSQTGQEVMMTTSASRRFLQTRTWPSKSFAEPSPMYYSETSSTGGVTLLEYS